MMRSCFVVTACVLAACSDRPLTISPLALSEQSAGNPTAAFDARTGSAFAVWVEKRDSLSDVYIARIDSAGGAGAVRVNDIRGDAAPHDQAPPQVETAPDGTIYVLWQNNTIVAGRRFAASNLRLARSSDGGRTFDPAVFVNDDAAGAPTSHTFQDIAVSGDGTVYVSWLDGRTGTGAEVRVAKSTDGGRTFNSGVIVHTGVCPCCRTSLAVHSDTIFVSFRSEKDNIRDIVVARSVDGAATFGEPVRVHEDRWVIDGCPHSGASLALDGAGRLHVAWYTGAERRQGIWHTVSRDRGASFETPVALNSGDFIPVSQVKIAADVEGSMWIAWDDRRDGARRVRLAVSRNGSDITDTGWSSEGHSPAITAGSDVFVAWQEGSAARAVRAHH